MMRVFFVLAFVLHIAITLDLDEEDENACAFSDPEFDCEITCVEMSSSGLFTAIQNMSSNRPQCAESGVHLKLQDITFINSTLEFSSWNSSLMHISQLYIYYNLTPSTDIKLQPGAFNSSAFRQLQTLYLANLYIDTLPARLFDGLIELAELHIREATILMYEPNVFNAVRTTLKELHLQQIVTSSEPPNLNTLLAGITFNRMDTLTMRTNLAGQLNAATFTGLSTLFHLDLAQCHIQTLGPHTFDPLAGQLNVLQLAGNHLRTIPADLFDPFVGRFLRINLDDNPWHCDCALRELQTDLERIFQIFGKLNCATPAPCLTGEPVHSAVLCMADGKTDIVCEVPTTTTESTTTTASTTELDIADTTSPGAQKTLVATQCMHATNGSCETLDFETRTNIESIRPIGGGWLIIQVVKTDECLSDCNLIIWFETMEITVNESMMTGNDSVVYYETSDNVMCQSSQNLQHRIGPLRPNTAYTVCLLSRYRYYTTLSPFDCFPYYNHTRFDVYHGDVWIFAADKPMVVGLVVFGAVLSLVLGAVLMFMLFRRNPAWLRCLLDRSTRVVRVNSGDGSTISTAATTTTTTRSHNNRTHRGRGSDETVVMPIDWQKRMNNCTAPRYSDVSTICDRRSLEPPSSAAPKYMLSDPQFTNENRENRYYLDYLPPMAPPPLPPPNHPPMLYGMARANADAAAAASSGATEENYYSQVGVKSNRCAM